MFFRLESDRRLWTNRQTDRQSGRPTDWLHSALVVAPPNAFHSAIVAAENELLYCIIESLQASIARVA